ncbi:hypothetical protein [Rhodococcus sp. 077-4]|uniref:hypothetical protein n=1 Tax=Rhodococcus sp. 077-4 TaxID=2789271 RepID=UPI0039F4CB10
MNVVSPTHYTVHETDVALAGNWTVVALGPIDHGGVAGIRRALRTAMSIGPAARLGLLPDRTSRRWRYDPERLLRAVRQDSPITEDEYDSAMADVLSTHDQAEPISIVVRGDHVVFYMDHGIGDGQMIINISHTLADVTARHGIVPQWATAARTDRPLAVATLRCFGSDPRRLLRLLRSRLRPPARELDLRTKGAATVDGSTNRLVASPSITSSVCVVADAATIECTHELTRWRDAHRPGQSISILFFAALDAALRSQGVVVDDVAKVLFDVRRYLPAHLSTLANLSAGIDVALPDTTDTAMLSRRWKGIIDSGHPVANLVLVSLHSKLGRLRSSSTPETPPPASDTVRLALSDIGRHPRLNDIGFIGESTSAYRAMVAPASHGHVTLTTARLRNSIRVTASFHAEFVDADTIRRALRLACSTPIELLAPGSADSPESDRTPTIDSTV